MEQDYAALARLPTAPGGALAANLLAFGRLLRRAGVPVGPAATRAAAEALALVDIADRRQVHAALRSVMVRRHEQFEIFDQAFLLFWRDPEAGRNAAAMAMLEGSSSATSRPPPAAASPRPSRRRASPPARRNPPRNARRSRWR